MLGYPFFIDHHNEGEQMLVTLDISEIEAQAIRAGLYQERNRLARSGETALAVLLASTLPKVDRMLEEVRSQ